MLNTTVIGLDIGRSAVKVVAVSKGIFHHFMFRATVSPAIAIGNEDAAERAALETVTIAGKSYFTGQTAIDQGRVGNSLGLSDDWTDSAPYLALVASAMKRLAQRKVPGLDTAYLVIGTPSKLFKSHKDSLARRTLEVVSAGTQIRVLPQPMGAFSSFALNPQGAAIKENYRDETGAPRSWAVIEVGHFTTDFLLMRKGVYVESASISCEGNFVAINELVRRLTDKKLKVNHIEAEEILCTPRGKTPMVKHYGKPVDVSEDVAAAIETCADKIEIAANTLLSDEASSLDGVLLAGGGAEFVFRVLQKRWPNVQLVADPRMAVAEGYCRFGVGVIAKREMEEKAAVKA